TALGVDDLVHDGRRDRQALPARVADGGALRAAVRRGCGEGGEVQAPDVEDGDVDVGVEEDDGGAVPAAVGEDDDGVPGAGDHVGVGEDVVGRDREAGAGDDAVAADAGALDLDRLTGRLLDTRLVDLGGQRRRRAEDGLQAREGGREGDPGKDLLHAGQEAGRPGGEPVQGA